MLKGHTKSTQLSHYLPIITWAPSYQKGWLRPDLMAGLTLAAFTIPEALAYAELAGLPPQAGLYASMLPPILYMFFGTSRQLVIGPTAAISVLLASGLAALSVSSPEQYVALAALTAILVGLIAIAAYVLRLGFWSIIFPNQFWLASPQVQDCILLPLRRPSYLVFTAQQVIFLKE